MLAQEGNAGEGEHDDGEQGANVGGGEGAESVWQSRRKLANLAAVSSAQMSNKAFLYSFVQLQSMAKKV